MGRRSKGERTRLTHSIGRMESTIRSLRDVLDLIAKNGGTFGNEVAEALTTSAREISVTLARHDAFEQVAHDPYDVVGVDVEAPNVVVTMEGGRLKIRTKCES